MLAAGRRSVDAASTSMKWTQTRGRAARATVSGVWLAESNGMTVNRTPERRTHPGGRAQFEAARADLETRLRRIYGPEWPPGIDELISRIGRGRVRDTYGLARPR
jgi:hypothetical protein